MTDLEMFKRALSLIFASCTHSVDFEVGRIIITYDLYTDAQEMFKVVSTFDSEGNFISQKLK